jgi:hypothetical protein
MSLALQPTDFGGTSLCLKMVEDLQANFAADDAIERVHQASEAHDTQEATL